MRKLIRYLLAAGAIIALVNSNSHAQKKLYTTSSENLSTLTRTPAEKNIYENIKARALGENVRILKFKKEVLTESKLVLNIEGRDISVILDELDLRGSNDFSWHGHMIDGSGSVVLIYLNDQLAGSIIYNGKSYKISPFGKGDEVILYQVDPAMAPQDHPPSYDQYTEVYNMDVVSTISSNNVSLRVLVAFTPSAESGASGLGYDDMKLFVQQAVSETNQSFINSNVSHRVVVAASIRVSYSESGSFNTDLARFESTSDGYMDEIHTYRDKYTADVGVIIINNSSACGLASGIGSTASTAFAAVDYSCTLGYFSFAHEIGHLHGARHNPEQDPNTTPYSYGHGFYNTTGNWRTVMSYPCPGGCTRIPYWSNPNVTYGGTSMGTPSTHNNARVLNETAQTLAGYRTTPSYLLLTANVSMDTEEIADAVAVSTITMTPGFTVATGADFYARTSSANLDALSTTASLSFENSAEEAFHSDYFQVYPNPNSGAFYIKLKSDNSKQIELRVFDLYGKEIYKSEHKSGAEFRINLPTYKPGIYHISLKTDDGATVTKRLSVE